jgi:hypothetical protein
VGREVGREVAGEGQGGRRKGSTAFVPRKKLNKEVRKVKDICPLAQTETPGMDVNLQRLAVQRTYGKCSEI